MLATARCLVSFSFISAHHGVLLEADKIGGGASAESKLPSHLAKLLCASRAIHLYSTRAHCNFLYQLPCILSNTATENSNWAWDGENGCGAAAEEAEEKGSTVSLVGAHVSACSPISLAHALTVAS